MENALTPKQDHLPATSITSMPEFQAPEEGENLKMARLQVMQDLSPLVRDRTFNAGDLINSLSKENYGKSLEIIPLLQGKSSRIRWKTRAQGGGIACVARDGRTPEPGGDPGDQVHQCDACPFFKVRKGKDNLDDQWCSMNFQVIALIRDTKEPILLTADSIRSSDVGIRDMIQMARMAAGKGVRLFGRSYTLATMEKKNAKGTFQILTCVPKEVLPVEETAIMAEQMQFFAGTKLENDGEETPF